MSGLEGCKVRDVYPVGRCDEDVGELDVVTGVVCVVCGEFLENDPFLFNEKE